MKRSFHSLKAVATALFLSALFAGCESTDDGGGSVSGGMYYGVGFYDPWYYGGYYGDGDIIITPPSRPETPVRPSHPIARPPSIPSTPRPMPRGGGGRR